ncbi:MAG: ATP-binding protein [Oscillospiraceae bacterium]|nr:ATP-binding protein [Oscillospiraceae bacterium]
MKGGLRLKVFTTTGACIPENNYMVDITERLKKIRKMVDAGDYFTINRARQYGKTTTLTALKKDLNDQYDVLSLDFQDLDEDDFSSGRVFTQALAHMLIDECELNGAEIPEPYLEMLREITLSDTDKVRMADIFRVFRRWCKDSDKPVVLIIDEVDSASNNQVFLDFLAQLRSGYIARVSKGADTFHSVILAGVTDVKNLKRKLRPEDVHKFNSPWNIAANFNIDMSLSADGIAGMLDEYEKDHHTGMDTRRIAEEIFDYTSGYPYLVSCICQTIDERLTDSWNTFGVGQAVKLIITESNMLFDSLMGKVSDNEPLSDLLERILLGGEQIIYNQYNIPSMDGEMYGFLRNNDGVLAISNRMFEVLLYNYFLGRNELRESLISRSGFSEKENIIENGKLNMEKLLERYVTVFDDIYEGKAESFDEEEGRRRFLLFVRPIINGTGNYYVEARTRNNERMDIVIDYHGERFVIELKIWRGEAYHEKGEKQLAAYLEHYHLDKGYLLTYSFNKKKNSGLIFKTVEGKNIAEAFV